MWRRNLESRPARDDKERVALLPSPLRSPIAAGRQSRDGRSALGREKLEHDSWASSHTVTT